MKVTKLFPKPWTIFCSWLSRSTHGTSQTVMSPRKGQSNVEFSCDISKLHLWYMTTQWSLVLAEQKQHHKKLCSRSGLNGYQPISVPLSSKREVKHAHISRMSRRYFRSEGLEANWSYFLCCRCSPELVFAFFFFLCGWLIWIYGNFHLFQT